MRIYKRGGALMTAVLLLALAGCSPENGEASDPTSSGSTKLEHVWETVTPTRSAEESAKLINNTSPTMHDIESEAVNLYIPTQGASYTHHPFLASFKGRLYAMFSLGKEDEDD